MSEISQPQVLLQPAEWTPHRAVWMAWPSHPDLWEENLSLAQQEFVDLCHHIACIDPMTGLARGELLEILVATKEQLPLAIESLKGLPHRIHQIAFGDIWLRDTAPIFVKTNSGDLVASVFNFNGWGSKYILPHDSNVAEQVAKRFGKKTIEYPFVFEGGSIEVDGLGTGLTTEQCLLNPNRNPNMNKYDIETQLNLSLGIKKLIWLKEGLLNDHTDGHIDTIARFVAPQKVLCMRAHSANDPNINVLEQIASELEGQVDALGLPIEVIRIPSPGLILDQDGEIMPASYVNFYIGNASVIVPTYGSSHDAEAVATIAQLFPDKKTIGSSALAILSGGGAFHCITQQEPFCDLKEAK